MSLDESGRSLGIPVLPLRDVVVFPHMVIPLFVGRDRSMKALDVAMDGEKQILLLAQRSPETDDPQPKELYEFGTLASVLQLLKLPDGTVKVLVEGVQRARVSRMVERGAVFFADVDLLSTEQKDGRELEVMVRTLTAQFEQLVKLNRKIPPELMATLAGITDASRFADTIAAHLTVKLADKQAVLELESLAERLDALLGLVNGEIDVLQIEKRIRGRVKTQMEKSQREYYLNEQMKAIQKELGENEEAPNEIEELRKKIDAAGMPKVVLTKAKGEFAKLKMMSPRHRTLHSLI